MEGSISARKDKSGGSGRTFYQISLKNGIGPADIPITTFSFRLVEKIF